MEEIDPTAPHGYAAVGERSVDWFELEGGGGGKTS